MLFLQALFGGCFLRALCRLFFWSVCGMAMFSVNSVRYVSCELCGVFFLWAVFYESGSIRLTVWSGWCQSTYPVQILEWSMQVTEYIKNGYIQNFKKWLSAWSVNIIQLRKFSGVVTFAPSFQCHANMITNCSVIDNCSTLWSQSSCVSPSSNNSTYPQ